MHKYSETTDSVYPVALLHRYADLPADLVDITDAEAHEYFNGIPGKIRTPNVHPFQFEDDPGVDLSEHKEVVKNELRAACEAEIVGKFFISDAHTPGREYDCRTVDQVNLQRAHVAAVNSGGTADVYAHNGVEFVPVAHTAEQIAGVLSDMDANIAAKRATLYTAISAINASGSVEDVDAVASGVVW